MALFFCLLYFTIFASVRVTRTGKAMQTTAIGTVANSLPKNEVILLTLLISDGYIPYTDLRKKVRVGANGNQVFKIINTEPQLIRG